MPSEVCNKKMSQTDWRITQMTAVPDGASRVRMPRIGVSTSRLASLHELNLKECDEAMLRGEFDPTSLITQSRNDFKIARQHLLFPQTC